MALLTPYPLGMGGGDLSSGTRAHMACSAVLSHEGFVRDRGRNPVIEAAAEAEVLPKTLEAVFDEKIGGQNRDVALTASGGGVVLVGTRVW
jgi:hypothetical protein